MYTSIFFSSAWAKYIGSTVRIEHCLGVHVVSFFGHSFCIVIIDSFPGAPLFNDLLEAHSPSHHNDIQHPFYLLFLFVL